MTRSEFLDNVNEWWELIDFCNDQDCDICEDIYDEDLMYVEINDALREYCGDYSWTEIRDMLADIPTGYDYYYQNGSFDWEYMSDRDFERYKDNVIEWMDDGGYWPEEESDDATDDDDFYDSEDNSDAEEVEETEEPAEDEDFSVSELIGMCSVTFVAIQQENIRRIQEADKKFNEFIDMNAHRVLK